MIYFEFKADHFDFTVDHNGHWFDPTPKELAEKANQLIEQFMKDRAWLIDELEKTKDKLYLSIEKHRDRNMRNEQLLREARDYVPKGLGIAERIDEALGVKL